MNLVWALAEQVADAALTPAEAKAVEGIRKDIDALKHDAPKHQIPPVEPNPIEEVPQRDKRVDLDEDQKDAIFAEIEELLFLGGRHREDVMSYLGNRYGIKRRTARHWMAQVRERWRAAQASEELTDRHYQLERMAHVLYNRAVDGPTWGDVKKQIGQLKKLIDEKNFDAVNALIAEMVKQKGGDLKTAQRILWNLCAMAGYGTKVTVDVTGAGVTIGSAE